MSERSSRRGLGFGISTVLSFVADGVARLFGVSEADAYLALIVAGFTITFAWLGWIVVDVLRSTRTPKAPERSSEGRRLAHAAKQVEIYTDTP